MKQIVVLSGKGGTGKTTLTASLFVLAKDAVVADCDVDAPDLHLLLKPTVVETRDFYGGKLAILDAEKCIRCGRCIENCRFDAIDGDFNIDPFLCEGCGVCGLVCPVSAISYTEKKAGEIYISETKYGPMVHALLFPGEENSGKLVSQTRVFASVVAQERTKPLVSVDGPPGIGCPVISSITNVDYTIAVTEPTESAIHDFERLLELSRHFSVKLFVVVNKYDINEENTKRIERYCKVNNIPVLGKVPFDPVVTEAMIQGLPIVEYSPQSLVSREIKGIWENLQKLI